MTRDPEGGGRSRTYISRLCLAVLPDHVSISSIMRTVRTIHQPLKLH